MTAGAWAVALTCLAFICLCPFLGARRLISRLVPTATGALALLATVVLTLVLITWVAELLGSVGQFRRWPLAAGCLAAGVGAGLAGRTPPRGGRRVRPSLPTLMAAGLGVLVFARWTTGSGTSFRSGILDGDSLTYHLPFAATFAQTGWLSRLHYGWLDPVWTFYPFGTELFHSIGIAVFGHDLLSPLLNLGWLALAMLAAWCFGHRWGAGPITLAMVCVVLSFPVLAGSQAGGAGDDIGSLALLLSAITLLVTIADRGRGYLLAGLAAGLTASTTLAALPAIAGLAGGVLLLDRRKVPARRRLWVVGLLAAGGYWYLRDLVRIGNPLPDVRLGPLPRPALPGVAKYGFSVAHYILHGWFWREFVRPGLHGGFGLGWPLVGVLALVGLAASLAKQADPLLRLVSLAGVVAAVGYLFTPTSALGTLNQPVWFEANLRFLLPSVAMFLMVAAVGLSQWRPRWVDPRLITESRRSVFWIGVAAVLSGLALGDSRGYNNQWTGHLSFVFAGGTAALLLCVLALSSLALTRLAVGAVLVATAIVAGLPVANSYLKHRYVAVGPIYKWARDVNNSTVGIVAFPEQYPLFGLNVNNRVSYVATIGPHGSVVLATSCRQWRREVARAGYDFVVIGYNDWSLRPIPEWGWIESDPAAKPVVVDSQGKAGPRGAVFRVDAGIATIDGC